MYKIAITGSTGLVGSRIMELLQDNFEFIQLTHGQVDLLDKSALHEALKNISFDFFIHLAAYTNVDGAETNPELAKKLNVDATRNVLELVNDKKAKLIHFSTDFVFDGDNPPYDEDSKPNPQSVYGQTKFDAEEVVKDNSLIVRLAYPYRKEFEKKKDFVRVIKYFLENNKPVKMVEDASFTPTFIDDIALALKYLIKNYSPEIFHLVGTQTLSQFEAGKLIAKYFKLDESLVSPTTCAEYFKGKAKRPQFSEIKSKKNTFHVMHSFEEGLKLISKI